MQIRFISQANKYNPTSMKKATTEMKEFWKTSHVESGGVLKSVIDDRNYRNLTLDNGLKVLLIQDETVERSAACLGTIKHVPCLCLMSYHVFLPFLFFQEDITQK